MKQIIYNQKGEEIGKAELPAEIFEVEMNPDLVHQAVSAQMANSRKIIAHTKDRSQKRGGGRKPWRQKGTGRARHGSIRSPIWRGGGVTFGPTKERNFSKKINKKMKRKALFMGLSSKIKDNQMVLIDKLELAQAKTKEMALIISNLSQRLKKDLDKGMLIVLPTINKEVIRATRNIPKIKVIKADSLNIIDVLSHKHILVLEKSINLIKKTYLE